jgi:hypothetical protein
MNNSIKYEMQELPNNEFLVYVIHPKTKHDSFFRQEGKIERIFFKTKKLAEDFVLINILSN